MLWRRKRERNLPDLRLLREWSRVRDGALFFSVIKVRERKVVSARSDAKMGVWLRRLLSLRIANSPLQGSDSAILRDAILVKRPFWQSPQPTPPSSHCVLAKGKTGRRLQVGVVEGGEEVTQRLGREADGNYVCLALCTGRKRWLIPFGEIFVFTILYSFVYF